MNDITYLCSKLIRALFALFLLVSTTLIYVAITYIVSSFVMIQLVDVANNKILALYASIICGCFTMAFLIFGQSIRNLLKNFKI
jgi:hypothetical protein